MFLHMNVVGVEGVGFSVPCGGVFLVCMGTHLGVMGVVGEAFSGCFQELNG